MAVGKREGLPIACTKVVQIIGNQLNTNIKAMMLNTFAIFASEDTLFVLSQLWLDLSTDIDMFLSRLTIL